MLQIVKNKFAKLSNYPRLRILLIIVAIIIVFVIVMNLLTPSALKQTAPPSQVQTVTTQSARSTPAKTAPDNQSTQYQQLASADQAASEQKSIKSGGSVFQNAIQSAKPVTATNPPPVSPQQFAQDQQQAGQSSDLTKQIGDL